MERDFTQWLSKLKTSISDYSYYVDFDKVYRNVDKVRVELNILNSLIGSKHIEEDFALLVLKYPEIIKCIPLLLAVRTGEIYVMDPEEGEWTYSFKKPNSSVEQYQLFMRKTGLFDLMERHIINNLVDYATGVETGLDSNGRKNRGGYLMDYLVETYIRKAGVPEYYREMYSSEIKEKWDVDLSAISNQGRVEKRFDFVVKTRDMVYGVKTNFYACNGSKLNEIARSYKTLAREAQHVKNFTFVWVTDGIGWMSARHNMEETFHSMKHLYNIDDLENGVMDRLFA